GPVVAASGDAAAAAEDRVSADGAVVRNRDRGGAAPTRARGAPRFMAGRSLATDPHSGGRILAPAPRGEQQHPAVARPAHRSVGGEGCTAAASWHSRIKAADELIANADTDRRAIALVPLSDPTREITLMPGGAALVALRQLTPKPYAIERVETLAAIERFLKS